MLNLGGRFTASFKFSSIKGYVRENIIVVSARLLIIPLIIPSLAAFIGFTGEAFGGDEILAGQLIVLSSVLCILTLFICIFVFSYLGVI